MPLKLDAARIEKIVTALAAGNTRRSAALYAGVDPKTVERRVAKDPKLRDLLRDAEERAVIRQVSIILAAAKTSWQAAAWWLERRYPNEWGRHLVFSGTGPGGAIPVEATVQFVLPVNNRDRDLRSVRPPPRVFFPPDAPIPGNGDGDAPAAGDGTGG
jgi:hypothetical protein